MTDKEEDRKKGCKIKYVVVRIMIFTIEKLLGDSNLQNITYDFLPPSVPACYSLFVKEILDCITS